MNRNLDDDLRDALARQDAPDGFAERVLAATHPRPVVARRPVRWAWAGIALAASLTLGVGMVEIRREAQQRERGLEAKQELMQAMRVTGSKLRLAKEKVRHFNE